MRSLYSVAHKEKSLRPLYNIQVEVVHDYVAFFKPIINNIYRFYQVPHRYRIKRVLTQALCQYMLFTPADGAAEQWLPVLPTGLRAIDLESAEHDVRGIQLSELCVVNGRPTFNDHLGLGGSIGFATSDQTVLKQQLDKSNSRLLQLELDILSSQCSKLAIQDGELNSATAVKADIQKHMQKLSSQQAGTIMWLNFKKAGLTENSFLLNRPDMIPKLDDIQVPDCDREEVEEDDGEGEISAGAKIGVAAAKIASVCRKMLKEVEDGLIIVKPGRMIDIPTVSENYESKFITTEEKEWFEARKKASLILNRLSQLQSQMKATNWVWLKLPVVDEARLTQEVLTRKLAYERGLEICRKVLVRKKQDALPGQEIIPREGLRDVQIARDAKCIVDLVSAGDCGSKPIHDCAICKVSCCELHGPDHNQHQYWSHIFQARAQR
jgi:hypothetical protein